MKSTLLNHKGYYGSVEPSINEDVLKGKVLFVEDLIEYSASTVAELRDAFEAVVDQYLKDCANSGKIPTRPFKGQFNVRVAPRLHQVAALRAQTEGTSLNRVVTLALEKYLIDQITVANGAIA